MKSKVYIAEGGTWDGQIFIYHKDWLVEIEMINFSYYSELTKSEIEKLLETNLIYIGDL